MSMTLNDQTEKAKNDWNKLAKDALDLWQNHLTSLANDPQAKEEMAQLVGPMGKMFSDWTEMVQEGMGGMMSGNPMGNAAPHAATKASSQEAPQSEAPQPKKETAPAESPQSTAAPKRGAEEEARITPVPPVAPVASVVEAVAAKAPVDEPVAPVSAPAPAPAPQPEPAEMVEPSLSQAPVKDMQNESESVAPVQQSDAQPAKSVATDDATHEPEGSRGRPVSSDSRRGLVELADRLAFLERELEELRSKKSQSDKDAVGGADQNVRSVAGADTGTASS